MKPEDSSEIAKEIERLSSSLKGLHAEVAQQIKEIANLQSGLQKLAESSQIVEKAFRVLGFIGDYVEFGAYKGDSILQAYFAAKRVFDEIAAGAWNHSYDDKSVQSWFVNAWAGVRFIAFDSFKGIPEITGIDAIHRVFHEGTYACSEEEFRANIRKYGVPDSKVITVPGYFRDTLTDATVKRLELKRIAVLHIDSDLYESAKDALQFCTPFFVNGTIIIFDEWYQFYGHPELGEQRAFREWTAAHPDWIVTPFQKEGPFRNSFILNKPLARKLPFSLHKLFSGFKKSRPTVDRKVRHS